MEINKKVITIIVTEEKETKIEVLTNMEKIEMIQILTELCEKELKDLII